MKKKSVLLLTSFFAVLVPIVHSSQNNVPRFITNKTLDCTASHNVFEICQLTLVIEPLQSMTYYNITDNKKELRGYRASVHHIIHQFFELHYVHDTNMYQMELL